MHLDVIKSFICPTNAQLNCFKILKFTLRFTINALTCFGLTKPFIREPTVCASLKLQYWRRLKCFVLEVFGRVAAYAATQPNTSITKHVNRRQYCNLSEAQNVGSLMNGLVKPKHVRAFIVNLHVNFNILTQFNCALVGRIKDLIVIHY